MRPSISLTLEPGLDQGVPWGHDLYTFVTSAAGHMMRTLQKPRKNRPSKRQVNHRRFLHNMIQRKFADIEAANHRLASALYFKEKDLSSPPSQKPETLEKPGSPSQGGHLQGPDKCSVHTGADDTSKSRDDVTVSSHETEISEKGEPDSGHLSEQQSKSQSATCTTRQNNERKEKEKKQSSNPKLVGLTSMGSHHRAELFQTEYHNNEMALCKSADKLSEDAETTHQDSSFIQLVQNVDISPDFSPDLSLVSLDSCDFTIKMFTDILTYMQAQKDITDISECQWTDIMDLFDVSSQDFRGCMDVEARFESICPCQADAGQEVVADDVGFSDQSDSFTERICSNRPEVVDPHCEPGEYRCGYSCHADQGLTINHFQTVLRQNKDTSEKMLNKVEPFHGADSIQNQLPTSISYHYNAAELQTYQHPQEENPFMMGNCENNQAFTPFEGVAQSFSVPLLNPGHCPIPKLPHEDDWLFTDILKDRKSPDC